MKIYISADIEGITGVTHPHETMKDEPDYGEFREQMTAEVNAACRGAISAGADKIYVKDAHDSGRNVFASRLPQGVKMIRGWAGHPYSMMQGLDGSFTAVLMIGYHSGAGSENSPLAHTFNDAAHQIRLNGKPASEFLLNSYTAALEQVPVVFISGDEGICTEARSINPGIRTLAVQKGVGDSTISIHPNLALQQIEQGAEEALAGNISAANIKLPETFEIEIDFAQHRMAQRASFYPCVERPGARTIRFETSDYFEVLRMFMFVF